MKIWKIEILLYNIYTTKVLKYKGRNHCIIGEKVSGQSHVGQIIVHCGIFFFFYCSKCRVNKDVEYNDYIDSSLQSTIYTNRFFHSSHLLLNMICCDLISKSILCSENTLATSFWRLNIFNLSFLRAQLKIYIFC